ncbi:hypothetical protein V6N13_145550 [Hibiscus sabdariffa]
MPGGTRSAGGGGGGMGSTSQRLTTSDALTYLKEVKEEFQDQKEKYDMFLEVMKDFKARRTDTVGVMARVKELFKGHNNLIYGFNTFLSDGYAITFDDDNSPPRRTVKYEDAISEMFQRLTTSDALTYLKEVKEVFQDQKEKYDMFLEVMKDFKAHRTDTVGVIARVKELFKGHNNLIYGFNTFLPDGYAITLDDDNSPMGRNVKFEDAISFVNKIKRRFQHDEHVYKSFLDVLNRYRREHMNKNEVYTEVTCLFEEHPDLLEEFTSYLEDYSVAPTTQQVPYVRNSTQHYNERSSAAPTLQDMSQKPISNDALMYLNEVNETFQDQKEKLGMFLQVLEDLNAQRTDTAGAVARVKELFKGHNNLIYGFNTFLPEGHVITIDDDNDEALPKETDKFAEAIRFMTKVKKRFQNDEHVYKSFVDILSMYWKEQKGMTDVYTEVACLFKDHPDLLREFTRYLPVSSAAAPLTQQVPCGGNSTQRYNESNQYSTQSYRETNEHSTQRCKEPFKYFYLMMIWLADLERMKRARDDMYSGSQFRRPFGSSRAESYGQNQMPAGGSSAGGGSLGGEGEGEGGGGGQGEGSTSQRLTTSDALTYLKEVKEMFQDQKEKYDMFLEVMKDFKAHRTDTVGVIARVKELFKGHNNLIYGFNTFLPRGYAITLDEDNAPPRRTVEFDEAISFVNKIKRRFQHDEHVYKSFLDVLNMYRREHKDINEVYTEVASLFEDHPDLLEEFTRFLPDSSAAPTIQQVPYGRNSTQRYNERSSAPPILRHIQMDRQRRRDRIINSHADRDLSVDRPELDDDKGIMKMRKEQRKRAEKDNRDQRNRDHDDPEHENNREFNSQRFPDKKRSGKKVEGFASYDDRDNLKSMCNRGFVFCEKVKERLCSSDDYQAFLKCLNIYSNGIIKRNDLQTLVTDLLGKYPDLMNEFNQFLERCENTDGLLAGVISKKSLTVDGHVSRPLEEKDREPKREIEGTKEKERYKEYMGKSIQELDLSNCQSCTPSYRLLPDDYPIPVASQKSELGAQVLNDYWVSVTSGSEDYSFKHMRRNQYEESLFRCEDDRFELDMLLESVSSTAKRVEDLLNSINENKISMDSPFRVEEHFSVLNLRCIERLYGDHGLDAMEILRKNPSLALPVILTRLKQKQEEWTKCRLDFNKVWAEIYVKNHYKSLDHRSFYFKQQDSKNLSAKSLLAEIKELKEKNQKEDDVLMASVAGHRQPLAPHLVCEYLDVNIHEDLYKLIEYSCEEMCSTKEQLNRVMRLWTTFLEPMLGVPPRHNGREGTDGAGKALNPAESDRSPGADATANSGQLKAVSDGEKNSSSELTNSCRNGLTNGETLAREHSGRALRDDSRLEKETKFTADKKPGIHMHANGMEAGNNHGRNNVEGASGKGTTASRASSGVGGEAHESKATADLVHSSEGVGVTKHASLVNGMTTDCPNASRCHEESAGPSRIEKEEGELSPTGDLEEDNFVAYGDSGSKKHGVETRRHQSGNGKDLHSVDASGENDVDADDEDSENASEAGDNASGSESAGDECSREEHDEEEEVERDEVDGKAESEGEAEGTTDTHVGGDGTSLSFSERFLFTVKPLSKHVRTVLPKDDRNDSWVFYANDDFFVLFRLHQILYERILSAKTNTAAAEMKWKQPKDASGLDLYARFMSALYSLLDGSTDNSKFEDECRAIIGNQSYVLFTLDKLIFKLVKQLQAVAADEMDNKLLQLFDYEKSRKHWKAMDSVYYENARVLLHEENIYRLKYSSPPSRLSIQLMDNVIEKPEAFAVSMEPNFSAVLHNDFLSVYPSKKEPHGITLKRNKKKYANLDEFAATCLAMEGVELVNGLENKIACNSYKISYTDQNERKRQCDQADWRKASEMCKFIGDAWIEGAKHRWEM